MYSLPSRARQTPERVRPTYPTWEHGTYPTSLRRVFLSLQEFFARVCVCVCVSSALRVRARVCACVSRARFGPLLEEKTTLFKNPRVGRARALRCGARADRGRVRGRALRAGRGARTTAVPARAARRRAARDRARPTARAAEHARRGPYLRAAPSLFCVRSDSLGEIGVCDGRRRPWRALSVQKKNVRARIRVSWRIRISQSASCERAKRSSTSSSALPRPPPRTTASRLLL